MENNILLFPGTDEINFVINKPEQLLPVDNILDGARDNNLTDIILIGVDEDDELYLASNSNSLPKLLFLLENAKLKLLDIK